VRLRQTARSVNRLVQQAEQAEVCCVVRLLAQLLATAVNLQDVAQRWAVLLVESGKIARVRKHINVPMTPV